MFGRIEEEFVGFLNGVGLVPVALIPVSGRDGDNIAERSPQTVVVPRADGARRARSHSRRRPAGPLAVPNAGAGRLQVHCRSRRSAHRGWHRGGRARRAGDELVFYPSGKRSRIRGIEAFNAAPRRHLEAGQAVGFTLDEQIYVGRGEVAARAPRNGPREQPVVGQPVLAGQRPLVAKKDYPLKIGSARVTARVDEIVRVIDASNLDACDHATRVERHEVAECTLRCARPIAFDVSQTNTAASRFVLVDGLEISGGGIIREALPDVHAALRERVLLRNSKWEASSIDQQRRAARLAQRATLVIVTGSEQVDRKTVARRLEAKLFDEGRAVYFLGIGNVLYGVDADIARRGANRSEHLRRMAEVANLMLDAGQILIVTAQTCRRRPGAHRHRRRKRPHRDDLGG